MKTLALVLALLAATSLSYAQTNQPLCDGAVPVWTHRYWQCVQDEWQLVVEEYYQCPPDNRFQKLVYYGIPQWPCDEPPPRYGGGGAGFLGPDCQSPENWGTITITECVDGFWQDSTYLYLHCFNGTLVISPPPLTTKTSSVPCTNPPPSLSAVQTPCPGGQLLSRHAYSLCETDGFWHVVEDDTYLCPGDTANTTFRVFDAPTAQRCAQPGQTEGLPNGAPLPAGLLGWWPGEGNANDEIAGNNGTLHGGVTFSPGEVGQAFNFNGVDGYVSQNLPDGLKLANLTFAAWINLRAIAGGQEVIAAEPTGANALGLGASLLVSSGHLLFSTGNGSGRWQEVPGQTAIPVNEWHHVACSYDGATMRVFLDGVQDGVTADSTGIDWTDSSGFPAPAQLYFGMFKSNALGTGATEADLYPFGGGIDEIMIYGRALAADEINAIYAAGAAGLANPTITRQPQSLIVSDGQTATFTVAASGTAPVNYQWKKDGLVIVGATNATYTIAGVSASDTGTYTVDVGNAAGTIPSIPATLTAVSGTGDLVLKLMGLTNGQFELAVAGPSGLSLQLEVSTNLTDWLPLVSVTPFIGSYSLTDTNGTSEGARFYRAILAQLPPPISYAGNSLFLSDQVPPGFGPGAVLHIGQSGTGVFDQEVAADANGLYTIALDTSALPSAGSIDLYFSSADGSLTSPVFSQTIERGSTDNPAAAVPDNLVFDDSGRIEGNICTSCRACPPPPNGVGFFDSSATPTDPGTELATGKLRLHFPILSFQTRMLGFSFELIHASLVAYAGPVGDGFSDSYNMMIVQTGPGSGQIITPSLRVFGITSTNGLDWSLPAGFESILTLNTNLHRWTLAHYSGFEVQFYQGTTGSPGCPVAISDPNGNTTTLAHDGSGLLQSITTDLGQVETLTYTPNGLLASFTDHLGRTWTFIHDSQNRLTQILTPITTYAAVAPAEEVIDTTLAGRLVTRERTTTIGFTNTQYPSHITSITDDRGAVPQAWVYDAQGRVVTNFINGNPEAHIYGPSANPKPLQKLEPMNLVTRTVDREGNITDYEIHSRAGGPVGGAGQFGIRRKVTWTETGKGNPALRPGEPDYYEQRWLQDCDCLSPAVVTQPFGSNDLSHLRFDAYGIPTNWPRTVYAYNNNRQVTTNLYTDGTNFIQTTSTYQPYSFGQSNQFSRQLTQTDPRAYDTNPIYAGLNFVHTYQYDSYGNRTNHAAPTVTQGVSARQPIVESWTYNAYGQKLSHTDPNGDITTYTYYTGLSVGELSTLKALLAGTWQPSPGVRFAPPTRSPASPPQTRSMRWEWSLK